MIPELPNPVGVGILKNTDNKPWASAFVNFMLSQTAQKDLAEDAYGFQLRRHQNESVRGRNPARVTVTSRRTAAVDGMLLAALRAWRL